MNKVRFSLLAFALLALLAIVSVQIASADANQVDLEVVNDQAIAHAKNIFRDSHDDDEDDEDDEDDYDHDHDDEDDEDDEDDYEDDEHTHSQSESESESETPSGAAETPSESETRSAAPTKQPGQPSESSKPGQSVTPGQPSGSAQPQSPVIPSDAPNRPSPSPTQDPKNIRRDAVAFLTGVGAKYSSAYGNVTFTCIRDGCTNGEALVDYEFHNIPKGKHSFNIYEYGNTADEGRATGRYFLTAPPVRNCNSPPARDARAGDLGEIDVPADNSVVKGSFTKYGIFLTGDKSIIGRGIGLDEAPCDTTSDGKDRTNVVIGGISIAKPPQGFRSSSSSGAAPSSVKGGSCTFSPIGASGIQGSGSFRLVGEKNKLEIYANITAPKAGFYYAQIYTYGDLSDAVSGSSLGPVNYNNIGSRASLTKDAAAPGNTYTLLSTFGGIDLSGSSSIVGRGLAIYTYNENTITLHAACPIALSGPVPDRVCKNSKAANFNQASPCIMAAKLASKDTETDIDVEDGPSFTVPVGSLVEDELFVEVYEVDQEFEPPTVGKYSNINITSSIEFQPAGDHFDQENLPTITFPVEATKGFNLVGLISNDGKTWELLPNLKYDPVKGLTGSVPHFSFVSSGKAKKEESSGSSNNDVAIGVGVGVGVGGAAVIGAAGFYFYNKNKNSRGETGESTPLTPQEKYGNL